MLTKIRHSIGAIFLIIAMCSGDTENLIFPLLFMAIGIIMIEDLLGKDIEDTPYANNKYAGGTK